MGLMKKLTSVVVTAGLLVGLVGTAFAAYPADVPAAAKRMQDLGLVQGKGGSDLALNDAITRAELVTIIVRAFGKGNDAKLLKGAPAFPDTAAHWASGEIALAKNLIEANGFKMGMPDGKFNPDGKVTTAEAIAFVMKFLGAPADASKSWPQDYLAGAVAGNLISADDAAAVTPVLGAPATRGLVFYLADQAFFSYKLPSGKTVYTQYTKPAALKLTLDAVAPTTDNDSVTISGIADATAIAVYVGSSKSPVTLTNGKFSAPVSLTMGDNTIAVMEYDLAGNSFSQTVKVARTVGAVAKVEASLGKALLKAGEATDLTVVAKDAKGNVIKDADPKVTVPAEVGTYANGRVTAAMKPATGKVTVAVGDVSTSLDVAVVAGDLKTITVSGPTSAKIGQAVTFTAKGVDAGGNEVAMTGVQWSSTAGGVINPNTGEFAGTTSGKITVTAKVGDISSPFDVNLFGAAAKLAIVAPTNLIANGTDTKTVTVQIQDANGAVVTDATDSVTLAVSGTDIKVEDSSGTATVNPQTKNAVNGVATFTIIQPTDLNANTGFAAKTASLNGYSGTLTGAVASVTSVAPAVGSVQIFATPSASIIDIAGSVTVKAKVLDTTGVQITSPSAFSVNLTNGSIGVGTLSATIVSLTAGAKESGSVTFTPNGTQGAISISGATTAGYTVLPLNLTARIAGPAYQMAWSTTPVDNNADNGKFTMKVAVQDGLGTTKTNDNATSVTVTAKLTDGTTKTATGTVANGVASIEFSPTNTNELTTVGAWTFTAASGSLVAPAAVTANVTAGAPAQIGDVKANGTATTYTLVANGTQTATVSVEIQDKFGNVVPNATNSVTFTAGGSGVVSGVSTNTGTTVAAANGVASLTVTAGVTDGASTTISATGKKDANNNLTGGASLTLSTQYVGPAANIAVSSVPNGGAIAWPTAGTDFTVKFKVVDATSGTPRFVSTDNGRAVTLSVLKGSTVVSTQAGTVVNGIAKFTVNLQSVSTSYTFKAAANFNGTDKSITSGSVTVVAGTPASLTIDTGSLTSVETGTVVALSPVAKDAYGNTISGATITNFSYTLDGSADKVGAGKMLDSVANTFTAPATQATNTIADADGKASVTVGAKTTDNLTVNAVTISTYIAGPAYQVKLVSTPAAVTAAGTLKVTVGVYDGAGALKTNDNSTQVSLDIPANVTNPDAAVKVVAGVGTKVTNGTFELDVTNVTKAGTYQFESNGTTAASVTLVKASGISVVVNPDVATKVVADSTSAIQANGSSIALMKFRVTDANGNTVTNATGTVNFTASGGGAVLLTSNAPILAGVAMAQVKATTTPGTLVVTPSIDGSSLTMNAGSITVGVLAVDSSKSSVSVSGGTIIVQLKDINGNAVTGQAANLKQVKADNTGAFAAFAEVGTTGVYTVTKDALATKVNYLADGVTITFSMTLP
ncbi:MAG TPA: hypothetical protein VGK74_20565 [Symbiobacteriaceae bacterium]